MSDPMAYGCACGTCHNCAGDVPLPLVGEPQRFRHGAIKERLLSRIAGIQYEEIRPLAHLTVRSDDDPAIALIDAYASSLHILAWNAARLSDDGSILRTQDRDALVDLARLIGYEPRPAIAATTIMAFTLDTLPGSPSSVRIEKGTKVASIPHQDERPQIFETDAAIDAHAEWNVIKPVCPSAVIDGDTTVVSIKGVTTAARLGDLLLVQFTNPTPASSSWLLGQISSATRITDAAITDTPHTQFQLVDTRPILGRPSFSNNRAGRVYILGQRAAPFGATAPDLSLMTDDTRATQRTNATATALPREWRDLVIGAPGVVDANTAFTVDLDAVYQDAIGGRMVVFAPSNQLGVITKSQERSRQNFGLSAKISRITLEMRDAMTAQMRGAVRETTVYLQTEDLALYTPPQDVALPAQSDRINVHGQIALPVGRRIVLTGQQWKDGRWSDDTLTEIANIAQILLAGDTTTLVFERPVAGRFRSTTLKILGNCVAASHGETQTLGQALTGQRGEVLGSGSASRTGQAFHLKGAPLAYVPAPTARGYAPAIEVHVGDREYHEIPANFAPDGMAYGFTVKTVRDGKSEVRFAGRLPSGTNNITALYRVGGGLGGNLEAGRLTMAMAPVPGVASVENPVPAEGASDAQTVEDLRIAAPQSIRTLDRIVSLSDYEAFASQYRGIGKALATELKSGMRSVVCLTIATTELASPGEGSDVVEQLRAAIGRVAVPGRAVRIEGFVPLNPAMTIALAIDETAFRRRDVEAAVRQLLGTKFGPRNRQFAQALHRSAILAAAQSVNGVIAATLSVFQLPAGHPPESHGRLLSPAPTMTGTTFHRAGLLSVDPNLITFAEMAP